MHGKYFHKIIAEIVLGLPRTTCFSFNLGCPGVSCCWWQTPVHVYTAAWGCRAESRVFGCFSLSTLMLPSPCFLQGMRQRGAQVWMTHA